MKAIALVLGIFALFSMVPLEASPQAQQPFRPTFEDHLRALRSRDAYSRGFAANALGQLRDPRAVQPLITALRDRIADVRLQAVVALGNLGNPLARDPLYRAVNDRDERVSFAAGYALEQLGDPRSLMPFLIRLQSPSPAVRKRTADSLLAWHSPRVESALLGLVPKLNCGNLDETARALAALHSTAAVPVLCEALRNLPRYTACQSLRALVTALGDLGDPRALPDLLEQQATLRRYRRSSDSIVLAAAINKLWTLAGEAYLRDELKKKPTPRTRASLMKAMRQASEPESIDLLMILLTGPDSSVAAEALTALAMNPSPRITGALLALGKKGTSKERVMAARCLSERSIAQVAAGDRPHPEVIDRLIAWLADKETAIAEASAKALGVLPDQRTINALIRCLKSKGNESRRVACATALAKHDQPKVVASLRSVLKDRQRPVRVAADKALGQSRSVRRIGVEYPGKDPLAFPSAAAMYEGAERRAEDPDLEKAIAAVEARLARKKDLVDKEGLRLLAALDPYRGTQTVRAAVLRFASKVVGKAGKGQTTRPAGGKFLAGCAAYKARDLEKSIALFAAVVAGNPGMMVARNNLALALLHSGKDTAAIVHWSILREQDPSYLPALVNLTVALERAGRGGDPGAAVLAREAAAQGKGVAQAEFNQAFYLERAGDLAKAKALLSPLVFLGKKFADFLVLVNATMVASR